MHPARAYVLFSFLLGLGQSFTTTTYAPFIRSIGVSNAGIAALNALFWLMIIVAELPTGMLADGRSRAWSVRMGALSLTVGMLGYAGAIGFKTALICELIAGVGFAFLSGAQQAWLTDALARRGEIEKLTHALGTSTLMRSIGMCLGGLGGALLGAIDLRYPWIAEGIIIFIAYLVCHRTMGEEGEPLRRVSEMEALRKSWKAVRESRALVWAVIASACFGFFLPFNHYWSLFFLPRVGQAAMGFLWLPAYGALALAGIYVRQFGRSDGRGERSGIIWALALTGGSLAVMGLSHGLAFPVVALLLHEFGRGLFQPYVDVFMQRRVESEYRATYGSLHSFLCRPGYALVLGGVWLTTRHALSDESTIVTVWIICGSLAVIASALLWFFRPKEH